LNGGTCHSEDIGYICICEGYFSGAECQFDAFVVKLFEQINEILCTELVVS